MRSQFSSSFIETPSSEHSQTTLWTRWPALIVILLLPLMNALVLCSIPPICMPTQNLSYRGYGDSGRAYFMLR
jgi:hypothetical protein